MENSQILGFTTVISYEFRDTVPPEQELVTPIPRIYLDVCGLAAFWMFCFSF